MAMTTSGFANLLDPSIREVFYLYLSEVPTEHEAWININTMDRAYVDDTLVSDLGAVPEKAEGGSVVFEDLLGTDTKRYTARSRAKGFVVTRELWDDDQHSVIRRGTESLKRVVRHAFEVEAYRVLNNATSTTSRYLGIDSLSLLNTSHVLLDGGGSTYANKPSTDVDISYTAVQTAMLNFHTLTTDKGLPAYLNPSMAIVSGTDQFNAAEIFLNGQLEFGTADNNKNFVVNGPDNNSVRSLVISRYFDDTDMWFVAAPKEQHSAQLNVRTSPEFETMDDFYTGNVLVKTFFRFISGFSTWQGWYGSTGG